MLKYIYRNNRPVLSHCPKTLTVEAIRKETNHESEEEKETETAVKEARSLSVLPGRNILCLVQVCRLRYWPGRRLLVSGSAYARIL